MNASFPNDELSRRAFVTQLAKACLGVSLIPPTSLAYALNAQPKSAGQKAQHVIYLFMRGGMSHVDTFDTKPDAHAGVQGPVRTISTKAPDLRLSGYFPKLAEQAKNIALVNSLSHTQGAHEPGVFKVLTGYEQSPSMNYPALGSYVARHIPANGATLPPYIRLGGLAGHPGGGFMDARYAPVPVTDPSKGIEHTKQQNGDSATALRKRTSIADSLNTDFMQRYNMPEIKAHADMYADAVKLMTSKDLDAFDISKEKGKLIADYGGGAFGQGLLIARRLVERGTKFVEVDLGGWDTHQNNFGTVEGLAKVVDDAVSTLMIDLASLGLLESTLIVLTTEFGRSPTITGSGRNHHPLAYSAMIAGGGVKGGQHYGRTDSSGQRVTENPVTVLDFHATLGALMGVDPTDTFPGPGGGEFSIYGGTGAKRGVVIQALV